MRKTSVFRTRRHWLAVPTLRLAGDSQARDGGGVQHASVQTTELYLGTRQNLTDAPNDRIGLGSADARRGHVVAELGVPVTTVLEGVPVRR